MRRDPALWEGPAIFRMDARYLGTQPSAGDTLTTSLGGPVASPTSFNGLVSVNVRGNGGNDNMFLHVADSLTNAALDFVNLFGDAGGDNFGGAVAFSRDGINLAVGAPHDFGSGNGSTNSGAPVITTSTIISHPNLSTRTGKFANKSITDTIEQGLVGIKNRKERT